MKMISRQRSSSKRKLLTIVLVCGLAVLALTTPITSWVSSIFSPLDTTIAGAENSTSGVSTWLGTRFTPTNTLRTERDEATRALALREAELAALRATLTDAKALDALRGTTGEDRIIAAVLATPSETPYDTLVLDRGSAHGVQEGAVVFSEHRAPLGSVVRVHTNTSIVALFSTPGIVTTLYAPREKILAKATGVGGGIFSVLMPHGSDVREGDVLIMPTLTGEPVGTVSRVSSDPAEPGVLASVTHKDALRSLRFVTISREPFTIPSNTEIKEAMGGFASSTKILSAVDEELASTTSSSTRNTP
jgi:cell shape-determining protein MreC